VPSSHFMPATKLARGVSSTRWKWLGMRQKAWTCHWRLGASLTEAVGTAGGPHHR